MIQQEIIPAISNHKNFNVFLESNLQIGILMNFQLSQLDGLVKKMKEKNKTVFIHSELIKGLSSDEFGAIYLIQELKVDGIISSKARVIEICKKRNVVGVYRFFIKDTISLDQSIDIAQRLKPDFVEILPASCYQLIKPIKGKLNCNIWMGGLINTQSEIDNCLNHGAIGITTSNKDLWK